MAGSTGVVPELSQRARPQSVCVELRHYFDLMQAYQDWASGGFERILADGLSCQQQIMAATGALASPPLAPSASEKEPEQLARPARSKTAAM